MLYSERETVNTNKEVEDSKTAARLTGNKHKTEKFNDNNNIN
jgi:hypothetical protein